MRCDGESRRADVEAALCTIIRNIAADGQGPLTLLDFSDGALTRALLPCDRVEEAVVLLGSSTSPPLPACATSWVTQCKPAQLAKVRDELLSAARPRVVIASSSTLSPQQQLRLVQLFCSLPTAVALLLSDPSPPTVGERNFHKAVLRLGVGEPENLRLTMSMLPRDADGRWQAWRDWLARGLSTLAHVDESTTVDDRPLFTAYRLPLAAAAMSHATPSSASHLFPPNTLGVVDQLREIRTHVEGMVIAANEPILLTPSCSPPGAQRPPRCARLVLSSSARFTAGGYAEHHYVKAPPSEHGVALELELLAPSSSDDEADSSPAGTTIGYISLLAYGVDSPARHFPAAVTWRMLHAAEVQRLVVLPGWRGSGAKEALLAAACAPYTAIGYAVRVKTASESVHASFMRCALLAYEGHRAAGTTSCGVRRPMKRYARVLDTAVAGADSVGGGGYDGPPPVSRRDAPAVPMDEIDLRRYDLSWRRDADAASREGGNEGGSEGGAASGGRAGQAVAAVVPGASGGRVDSSPSAAWRPKRALQGAAICAVANGSAIRDDAVVGAATSDAISDATSAADRPTSAAGGIAACRALLNKLTVESFEHIVPPLASVAHRSDASLTATLRLLARRACREPIYASLYASACARLVPPDERRGTFDAALVAALAEALAECDTPDHDSGSGLIAAELTTRRLLEPTSLLEPGPLVDAAGSLLTMPIGRVCAYALRAGPLLHRREPKMLAQIVGVVERALGGLSGGAARASCRLVMEAERVGWAGAEDAARAREAQLSLTAVRADAASELGLVLAPRATPDAAVRGLREGWVHWFVGAPVVHPHSGENYLFDETVGKMVAKEAVVVC